MRRPISLLLGVVATLALIAPSTSRLDAAENDRTSIAKLGWLAGCWERRSPEHHTIEHWTAPRGGTMLGLNQTVVRGSTVAWEYLRITTSDGKLVLTALPSGQAETSFGATELTDSSVTFSNPQHDFPQTISYRRQPDGSLLGRIEGTENGKSRSVDFPFDAIRCDGVAP